MTEPGFNEDAPNFWAMTDEAWLSFQMWKAHNPNAPETSLAGLDFQPGCDTCPGSAQHWIIWHPVNRCSAFPERRQELLVCDFCLEEFEIKSTAITAEAQSWTWLLPWKKAECITCGMTLQLPSDVLQVVRAL